MPSDAITFWVPGVPIAQGSKTVVPMRRGGRRMIEHANLATKTKPANRLRDWRDAVTWAAKVAGAKRPWDGAIALELRFSFERPRTSKRFFADVKPDLSKLVRAVEDALTGTLWRDDAQVVSLRTSKEYDRYERPEGVAAAGVHVIAHRLPLAASVSFSASGSGSTRRRA